MWQLSKQKRCFNPASVQPAGPNNSYVTVPCSDDGELPPALPLYRRACVPSALAAIMLSAFFVVASARCSSGLFSTTPLQRSSVISAAQVNCNEGLNRQAAVDGGMGEKCFCLFTGHCMEEFDCKHHTLKQCQHTSCQDRHSLEITANAASFTNMKDPGDILTIPVPYYRDLEALWGCRGDAELFLAWLLEAGRRVFIAFRAGGPAMPPAQLQCIHLPGQISVQWLHVHTFIGSIPDEALPNEPPYAVCENTSILELDAARSMLRRIAELMIA